MEDSKIVQIWNMCIWGAVMVAAIVCTTYIACSYIFAANGYVETTLPGSSSYHWIKPDQQSYNPSSGSGVTIVPIPQNRVPNEWRSPGQE